MYRWIEHTSELELALEALSEEGVFADATAAFVELTRDGSSLVGGRREIVLHAPDRAALLVAWLEELVYLADAHGFVPGRLAALEVDGERLRALLEGHVGEPRSLVKAVTWHRLAFARADGGGWRANVVLDV